MENTPAVIEGEFRVVNIEDFAMTTERVVKQVRLIQDVMEKVMKKDEHYGTIPGTLKPSLYKPGAEKLSVTFRLIPRYEIKQSDLPNGHREYQIICTLIHAPTGQFFGQGVGSCTTMENKYRYRSAEPELTDKMVPKEYWDLRKKNSPQAPAALGGKGFVPKKTDAGWFIAKKSEEKVEHDNPADYYNTVLKMAKKRAHVDAVLTATAASDIFTQDIEDLTQNGVIKAEEPERKAPDEKKEQPKEQSLFERLMSVRSTFASLVSESKEEIRALPEEQQSQVKARWENAAKKGAGGVKQGAEWPLTKKPLPQEEDAEWGDHEENGEPDTGSEDSPPEIVHSTGNVSTDMNAWKEYIQGALVHLETGELQAIISEVTKKETFDWLSVASWDRVKVQKAISAYMDGKGE